jgi:hypothetical protein
MKTALGGRGRRVPMPFRGRRLGLGGLSTDSTSKAVGSSFTEDGISNLPFTASRTTRGTPRLIANMLAMSKAGATTSKPEANPVARPAATAAVANSRATAEYPSVTLLAIRRSICHSVPSQPAQRPATKCWSQCEPPQLRQETEVCEEQIRQRSETSMLCR